MDLGYNNIGIIWGAGWQLGSPKKLTFVYLFVCLVCGCGCVAQGITNNLHLIDLMSGMKPL